MKISNLCQNRLQISINVPIKHNLVIEIKPSHSIMRITDF